MIAISYRREDTLPIAGRLYDRLQTDFGKGNVFMDFDSIPYGVDFREHIKQMIDRSKVVIALIGPDWFGRRRQRTRRIDDPADFVRLEIAYAFEREIPVIPVLINDTPMPKPADLPPEIEALAFRNAVNIHVGLDFHPHTDRLVAGINRLIIESAQSAAREGHKPEIGRHLKTRPAPEMPREAHPPQHSAPAHEPPSALFEGPQLKHWKSARETPSGLSKKPPPHEHSTPPVEAPVSWAPSQKQRWRAILLGWASIKQTLKNRTDPVVRGAIFVIVVLLTGLLCLYFGSSRSKQWLRTPILPSVSEKRPHPAVAGPSPLQTTADFAKYAAKLREQEIAKIRQEALPSAAPSSSPIPATAATSPPPSSTMESSPVHEITPSQGAMAYSAEEVDHLIRQVRAVCDSGDTTKTLQKLEELAGQDPTNPAVLAEMALLYESTQQFEPAGKIWWKIYALGPNSGALYDLAATKLKNRLSQTPTPSSTSIPNLAEFAKEAVKLPDRARSTSTPESVGTSSPSARNNRTSQAWIGDFVRHFVAANQLRDVDANLAFYAADVDYFDDGRRDHAYIRPDIEKYDERWPIRRDSIEGDIQLREKAADKEYTASFKLDFYVESPARAEWSKGQFAIDLDISIVDGVPNISGIKEKLLHQQKGKTEAATPNGAAATVAPQQAQIGKLFAGKWKGTEYVRGGGLPDEHWEYTYDIDANEARVRRVGRLAPGPFAITRGTERSITWNESGINALRKIMYTLTVSEDGNTATTYGTCTTNKGLRRIASGTFRRIK